MKNLFLTTIALILGYTSLAQKLNCVDSFYVSLFTECSFNQPYDDDLSDRLTRFTRSLDVNNILGTEYTNDEQVFPCYRKSTEFGYALIVQRVNKQENNVKTNLLLVDKALNLIDDQFLGDKQLYHSYDNLNARKYDFMFTDESTLEVRCKVMDETYSNMIDEIHSHYSFSKDGIVCIEEDASQ